MSASRIRALVFCAVLSSLPCLAPEAARSEEQADAALLAVRSAHPLIAQDERPFVQNVLSTHQKEAVKAALARGADWLVARQAPDGHWGMGVRSCHGKKLAGEKDEEHVHDVGLTGLALIALLDAGHLPFGPGPYARALDRGLAYLLGQQDRGDGGCIGRRSTQRYVFGHAFAGYAIARAYAATGALHLRHAAQQALDFVCAARNSYLAWRYGVQPGDNDLAVTGAMMLPIHVAMDLAAEARRQRVPAPLSYDEDVAGGVQYQLDRLTDEDYGRVGYNQRGFGPTRYRDVNSDSHPSEKSEATTAIGLYLRLVLGGAKAAADGLTAKQVDLIQKAPVGWNVARQVGGAWETEGASIDQYYWWYAARALALLESGAPALAGKLKAWRKAVALALLEGQVAGDDPCREHGSWEAAGAWGSRGGRVYSTALAISTLASVVRQRGGASDAKADKQRARLLEDAKADVEVRLRAIEGIRSKVGRRVLGALSALAGGDSALLRLASVEALGRLGPAARKAPARLAERLGEEPVPRIRRALVFTLLRMQLGRKADARVSEALTAAAEDPDPLVVRLARDVQEELAGDPKTAWKTSAIAYLNGAHGWLTLAEGRGRAHASERTQRAATVRWRILRDVGLPRLLDGRVGHRYVLFPDAVLEAEGVLESIEATMRLALDSSSKRTYVQVREAYDESIRRVFAATAGDRMDRRLLAAALDLHFAYWARLLRVWVPLRQRFLDYDDGVKDVRGRLALTVTTLQTYGVDAANAVTDLQNRAVQLLALAAWRSSARLAYVARTEGAEEALSDAIRHHQTALVRVAAHPDLARWVLLGQSELLAYRARLTDRDQDWVGARSGARIVMQAPAGYVASRRVRLLAARLYGALVRGEQEKSWYEEVERVIAAVDMDRPDVDGSVEGIDLLLTCARMLHKAGRVEEALAMADRGVAAAEVYGDEDLLGGARMIRDGLGK